MRVDCALLCDATTVREGLLHVLGGGVTRITRPTFPAALGLQLALRIMVHPTEGGDNHRCRLLIQAEDGEPMAQLTIGFSAVADARSELLPGEELAVAVAVPLQNIGIPSPGAYSLELLIDGIHQLSVPFRVQEIPAQPEQGVRNDHI